MTDALNIVYKITKLIKKSHSTFQVLKENISPTSPGNRILCPTRWADALHSMVANYAVLQALWDESGVCKGCRNAK